MKKVEIYPATINEKVANPFFNNILTPILKLITLNEKKQPPVFLFSLSNAYVSPYGPVFKNGWVVKESVYKSSTKNGMFAFLSFCKKILKNKVRKFDGDCIVINHSWYQNYYHWMIEILPRMFLLKDELSDKTLLIHKNISKFHFEVLNKFNFKKILFIEDDEIIKCKKISFTSFPNYYINKHLTIDSQKINLIELNINFSLMREIKQWIQNNNPLLNNVINHENKKIYISRKKAGYRTILNELALEQFLYDYGFTKVFLEDYSFDEQVRLIHQTNIVIGIHGAGLTNILFMRPNMHVINLISDMHHEYCYLSIAGVGNINYCHINCSSGISYPNPAYNDIIVDINLIKGVLDSICQII